MNNPMNIIESGNGLSPEKYRALKIMFWEGMICRCLDLYLYNHVI